MSKKSKKTSRKLQEKKLKTAHIARKKRISKKALNPVFANEKINIPTIIKKNILPALVVVTGSFIFYFFNPGIEEKPFVTGVVKSLPIAFAKEEDGIAEVATKDNNVNPQAALTISIPEADEINIIAEIQKPIISEVKTSLIPIELPKNEKKAASSEDISEERKILKSNIDKIVKNTPMEIMSDEISKSDKAVAAFLLGIAMKESKYGIYSPKKDGEECYNYWGYRGKESPTRSGYSCFDSPEQAVRIVGNRIASIVKQGARTPEEMIVWKCGYSCDEHSDESVAKWIADVGINYYKLNPDILLTKK